MDHIATSETEIFESFRIPKRFWNRPVQMIGRNIEPGEVWKPSKTRGYCSSQMIQFDMQNLKGFDACK